MRAFSILLLVFVVSLSGCKKDVVQHPYAGTYKGNTEHHYWDMTGNNSTSTTEDTVEVLLDGDTIEVMGIRLHSNSIVKGETYFYGNSSSNLSLRFETDQLFTSSFSGGLGGGCNTSYSGVRMN